VKAGQLRHRLEIQASTEARDAAGQPIKTWATERSVSASIMPLKGQKLFQAQQISPRATSEVTLRGQIPVTTKHRFRFVQLVGEEMIERFLYVVHVANLLERGITTIALVSEVPA
jgi:SPP1 family predicted phage head-tail adaptor